MARLANTQGEFSMSKSRPPRRSGFAIILLLCAATAVLLSSSELPFSRLAKSTSGPRLTSIEALPELSADGAMCQLTPAAASQRELLAMLQSPAGEAQNIASPGPRNAIRDRAPLRV